MSEIKKINYLKMLILTLIVGVLFLIIGMLSELFIIEDLDLVLKVFLIIVLSAYAYKKGDFGSFFNLDFDFKILAVIIIPLICSVIIQVCPLDFEPFPSFIAITVIGTVTTAIWEELFFRYYGCSLFDEDGKFKWYNIIFLALIFSITHLVNIVSDGVYTTSFQMFFTFGLGIFLLSLYIHTKAIIVPIIAHFLINSVADYFNLFATAEAHAFAYIGSFEDPFMILYVAIMIIIGVIILKRYNHIA